MKKRVNLLRANRKFVDREALFLKIRSSIIAIFFILLFLNIVLYLLLARQQNTIVQLGEQKKGFVDFFLQNKEADAKFAYFRGKQKQLSSILRQDVNFYPYYNLLKDSLDNYAVDAQLYSVAIDKTKSTNFTISFQNYENLINFLRYAESEEFLKNFNQLSLVNFSKKEQLTERADYRLNFIGKFINLPVTQE